MKMVKHKAWATTNAPKSVGSMTTKGQMKAKPNCLEFEG